MRKQEYQSPTALIVLLGKADVITSSGAEKDYDKGVVDFFFE